MIGFQREGGTDRPLVESKWNLCATSGVRLMEALKLRSHLGTMGTLALVAVQSCFPVSKLCWLCPTPSAALSCGPGASDPSLLPMPWPCEISCRFSARQLVCMAGEGEGCLREEVGSAKVRKQLARRETGHDLRLEAEAPGSYPSHATVCATEGLSFLIRKMGGWRCSDFLQLECPAAVLGLRNVFW